jgi:hypothetical protein
MRRNVETNKTAVIAQTICLAIVALFFFAALLYALTHPEPPVAATSDQPSHTEIGSLPGYPSIPQP